jgi:hypothetical protein
MKRNDFKILQSDDCPSFEIAYNTVSEFIHTLKHKLVFGSQFKPPLSTESKKQYNFIFSRLWILLTTEFIVNQEAKESLTLNFLSLFFSYFFDNKEGDFDWSKQSFVQDNDPFLLTITLIIDFSLSLDYVSDHLNDLKAKAVTLA